MSVIDPAANQMEEVHCDREVETLLPSTDEEPQTESTERKKSVLHVSVDRKYKDAPARWLIAAKMLILSFLVNETKKQC